VTTANTFDRDKQVRFHHCDMAGIVFYPKYFVLLQEVIEDWFTFGLDVDYASMTTTRRLGTPTVRMLCQFLAPSMQGETLRFSLNVREIGRSSINLSVRAHVGEEARVDFEQTLVLFSLDSRRSVPIPTSLRERMLRYSLPVESSGRLSSA